MRLAEVQRRVLALDEIGFMSELQAETLALYSDTLRTLLDHDLPDDARQLIEAALEAER